MFVSPLKLRPCMFNISARLIISLLLVGCANVFAVAQSGSSFKQLERAIVFIRAGQLAQAEAVLSAVLKGSPQDANALNLLGVVRANQKRTKEAETLFRRALVAAPSLTGAHVNLGELYITTGQRDAALDSYARADELAPGRPDINSNLALLYEAKRDFQRAEKHYTVVLASQPDDVASLRALARIADAQGELEKSLSFLIRARKLQPAMPDVLYDFGRAALSLNLLEDAIPVFEKLHTEHPRALRYLFALAVARFHKGETVPAQQLLARYTTLAPNDSRGHHLLGVAHYSLQQYTQARAALLRSHNLVATADTEFYLGLIAHEAGDTEQAETWLRRAIGTNPQHPAAHAVLGAVRFKKRDFTQARVELERAVELNPLDLNAHYQLGLTLTRIGDKAAAQRQFERADELRKQQRQKEVVGYKLIDPPQQ